MRKIVKILSLLLFTLFAYEVFLSIQEKDWVDLSISVSGLLLILLSNFITNKKFAYPYLLSILIFEIFIFLSIYLGSLNGFYAKYIWWDTMLHFFGGFLFTIIFFTYFLRTGKIKNIGYIILIAFMASIAVNTWWEIFEFAMDKFINFNMQRGGLKDTMEDIIAANIGALFAVLYKIIKNR